VYAGDASNSGSTSAALSQVVNAAATSTVVASAPNPSVVGESVTITATVSVSAPGAGTATGSVEFFDGATSLGTATLSGGAASISTSALALGSHDLTAVYAGDANFTGSTSAIQAHVVGQSATSTALASSANPSTYGESVTFTATVSVNPPGSGTATGTVEFFDGATSLGTATLSGGSAAISTAALAAGTHSITAQYLGSADLTGSTSAAVAQVVGSAGSSVSLAVSANPSVYLDALTLTATVTPSAATGTVEFFDGATSLGAASVSGGSAAIVVSSLAVGSHSLTAVYSGESNYGGATSAAVALEVKASIVATAGANGSIAPSGTTLYSLNATPTYTFTADAGYHVSAVTVNGAAVPLAASYTFAPVSSNQTIDVQFEINPPVAAIANLTATQVRTGNDTDGNTAITLTWSGVAAGSTVEVWRKGFGNYPEYDDGPSAGSTPAIPSSYPPVGWTLTSVTASGSTDQPGARDFHYYVAYVTDVYGTRSAVSNRTTGTLNYHLGDVSNGVSTGAGDNSVNGLDLSVLGAHYGITGAAVTAYNYLDVGPTTNLSVHARPTTDNRVNFEDLAMFAINYTPITSGPLAHARPASAREDGVTLAVPEMPKVCEEFGVRVDFTGTGRMQAMAVQLAWDPAVVEPVGYTAGDLVLAQDGVVFSAEPGSVDGASFAGAGNGLVGEGEFATVRFRVKAAGDAKLAFARVEARDAENRSVTVRTQLAPTPQRSFVTAFAPAMPNPFQQRTTFMFSLSKAGRADLEVYSVDGRRVRTVTSGVREAGDYRLEWNGADDQGRTLPAGVYYARLVTPQGRFTRVVTFLR